MFPRVAVLSALVASAAAAFDIVSPSADVWWVAKSINTLKWDCQSPEALAHPTYTILVANKDVKVLTAPLAIIGIVNNYDCSKSITADQLSATPGTGYTIQFANPLNQTEVWATSPEFEIKALGSTYPTSTPAIAGATSSGSGSGSAASTGTSGSNAANPSATQGNNAASNVPLTVSGLVGAFGMLLGLVL